MDVGRGARWVAWRLTIFRGITMKRKKNVGSVERALRSMKPEIRRDNWLLVRLLFVSTLGLAGAVACGIAAIKLFGWAK